MDSYVWLKLIHDSFPGFKVHSVWSVFERGIQKLPSERWVRMSFKTITKNKTISTLSSIFFIINL